MDINFDIDINLNEWANAAGYKIDRYAVINRKTNKRFSLPNFVEYVKEYIEAMVDFDINIDRIEENFFVNDAEAFYKDFESGYEEINCSDVVYDEEQDSYVCPVCGTYAADKFMIKDLDYSLPKHCHECGAKLHY